MNVPYVPNPSPLDASTCVLAENCSGDPFPLCLQGPTTEDPVLSLVEALGLVVVVGFRTLSVGVDANVQSRPFPSQYRPASAVSIQSGQLVYDIVLSIHGGRTVMTHADLR